MLQADDQTAQVWWKISSRDANSGANETNIDGNKQSRQKIRCFWYLLRERALSKQNVANWWPNRAGMGENLIPRRQLRSKRDQYRRKLAIYTKKSCFWCLLQKRALKKKCCKLMTKPRRYGGKSHPATPTQEQTRPISTETSNLYKTYTVSDISCVNGHCRNKTIQIDDQTAQIWGKISSRDANSGANETNIDGN